MDHALLGEVFRAAGDYHSALAAYAARMRDGTDIESAAQTVVGTSLRYGVALEKLAASDDEALALVNPGRLERMRRVLTNASRRYNMVKTPPEKPARGGRGAP
jgi:hypothetical protein